MQSTSQVENLRESYRYPIDVSQKRAQMRFGETWTPVELLDESAGGFGVRAACMPDVAVGDVVRLRNGSKCFDVEVMHFTQCPAVAGCHDEKPAGPSCLLGVKRVSEIFQEADDGPSWLAQIRATWRRQPFSLNGKALALGLALAFLAGILPVVVLMPMGKHIFGSPESKSAPDKNRINPEEVISYSNPFNVKMGKKAVGTPAIAPNDDISIAKPLLNDRQKADWQLLLDRAKLQMDIGPWRDEVLALVANMAEQIHLTDLQQVEIVQLLKYSDESLAKLKAADSADKPQEFAQKRLSILEETYINLMQMLTDEQKIEWDKLVEKWGEAPKAKQELTAR